MNKTIFITGATSGFGKAIAEKFAADSYRLIITGRRKDRLEKVSKNLKQQFNTEVLTLNFDVREKQEVKNAVASLPDEWKQIDILVNNAGLAAGFDLIQDGNTDDWDEMIDTNVKGLLYMTRAIAPLMVERKQGHIFNVGSTAAKYVYEKGNVYCASKFAVDALSQAMRIDLLKHNIKVTAIHPGAVKTEFALVRFKGDEEKANAVYKGFQPLSAEDIADVVFYCATLPPHVCINELVITPTAQANQFYFNRNL
ncbi:MAG TPA: SDR family NAD(P)-dependent oxidoreductase [Chitinophagales bacterium]|nr:SDR family NAD(P)-dependent oxidoreductase [Chitinophagales bacterium]